MVLKWGFSTIVDPPQQLGLPEEGVAVGGFILIQHPLLSFFEVFFPSEPFASHRAKILSHNRESEVALAAAMSSKNTMNMPV